MNRKRVIRVVIRGIAAGLISIGLLFLLVYAGVFGQLPSEKELRNIQNHTSSEIYSNDRVLLGKYYYQDRTNVSFNDLPDHLTNALIATEDVRFYEHGGIDTKSMFRVVFKSILLQKQQFGGGSTIQQQLAKNLYPRKHYALLTMPVNKFREMIIGVRLDRTYTKEEILELYLNTVSFGENTYGIETAAHRFFNKHPRYLDVEESALLVGMLKGTHHYNPRHYPERARKRRDLVLSQMGRYQYLAAQEVDSLRSLPVELDYVNRTHNEGPAPYFREHLRQVLVRWAEEHPRSDGSTYNIYTDGLKIYTTINADLQRYAERAVKAHMTYLQGIFDRQWGNGHPLGPNHSFITKNIENSRRYERLRRSGLSRGEIMDSLNVPVKMDIFTWKGMKEVEMSPLDSVVHYANFLHAGLLSVEIQTGYVRAWAGGINSEFFKYDHVTSRRQAGSTFKPIVYAAALENGHDPCVYMANDSVVYEEYDDWTPGNANGEYGGYYSMEGALAHSVNTISVKLLDETGIEKVIDLAGKMGIRGELPEVLSLALGTGDVSLEEMVRAYMVFPNEGTVIEPVILKRIEDNEGHVLFESKRKVQNEPVLEQRHAKLMTEMMKSVVDTGTASSLRTAYGFENEIAGKTGTTQKNTDGWFIGYTPVLITGVWVGGDHPVVRFRYGGYGQGASAALPIWARYMQYIYRDPLYSQSKELSFEIPESIRQELDCEEFLESDQELRWEKRRRWIRDIFDFNKRNRRKR